MPWLAVQEEGQSPRALEVAATPFRIGRRGGSDLVLADHGASREHCRIDGDGTAWWLVDLGAANGTYLNGRRLAPERAERLRPGDEIRVSRATLHFFDTPPDTGAVAPVADTTAVGPAGVAPAGALARGPDVVRALDAVALPRSVEYFTVLHELAKLLLAAHEVRAIGEAALDLLVRAMPVERAAIALGAPDEAHLTPLVHRTREGPGTVAISRTIGSWVLRERVAVITSDARHDPRFQRGESIHAYHIRSALCVPLWSGTEAQGVVYLDNLYDAHAFTEAELELVTAVANQVAIGIRQSRLAEQLRDEAVIRANLARYHSPDVVEMILRRSRGGHDLGIEVAEAAVTVLFADITGFTALAERLEPGEVAELLNAFFDRATRAIFRFRGSVNKYIGDAVMAIFGTPIPAGNHGELAVRAALAIQAEVAAVQETLAADRRFQVRVGVNSGRVVAGNIGSAERMEFTVLGDPVNVAQRIEAICVPGKVYVGEETYRATCELFQFRDLGGVTLRGKREPIRAYEVLG